ncbi:hypothetical protein EV144_101155 [Flavobacterium sp. 270]|nr:hypothetical protein EV144_101155 [Flavobacterium sp. 270]
MSIAKINFKFPCIDIAIVFCYYFFDIVIAIDIDF